MKNTEEKGINILDLLQQDHRNISKLLDIFEKQITIMQGGDNPDYRMMQDIMHYMGHYPNEFHHPREEQLYEKIKNRSMEIKSLVSRIDNEHITMGKLTDCIKDRLTEIFNGSIVPTSTIYELSKEFLDIYRKHIEFEERDMFPLIRESLTEQDWMEINASVSNIDDPLFGKTVEDFYQYLYSCIKDESSNT